MLRIKPTIATIFILACAVAPAKAETHAGLMVKTTDIAQSLLRRVGMSSAASSLLYSEAFESYGSLDTQKVQKVAELKCKMYKQLGIIFRDTTQLELTMAGTILQTSIAIRHDFRKASSLQRLC
jgi:hypothetical protein